MAWLIVLTPAAHGQGDGQTVALTGAALKRGYTVVSAGQDVRVGLPAGALFQPARLTLARAGADAPPLPAYVTAVSARWSYTLETTGSETLVQPLRVQVSYAGAPQQVHALYLLTEAGWSKLPTSSDRPARGVVTARLTALSGQLLVGQDNRGFVGLASWYRSRQHPYGAASNDLPLGSRARVTNLATRQSVVVTIVSRGPFVRGRVIDLSLTAFGRIASRSAGLATVRVDGLDGSAPAPSAKPPTVAAAAALVYDPTTDQVVWGRDETAPRPIASISKLAAGLAVQATEPDYRHLVTMRSEDTPTPEPGVRIRVAAGQTISVRDLFYSMITGSANNATLALGRVAGFSRPALVDRLNALAAERGWTTMRFADSTGLAVENVASAIDVARLAALAFQDPLIRKAGARRTFTYTIQSTGERRTITHPAYLYNHTLDQSPIVAAKTGFINEAGHCLVALVRGAQGKTFVVVVLGSPSTTTRSRDTKALIDWAVPRL